MCTMPDSYLIYMLLFQVFNKTVKEDFQVFWGQEVKRHVLKIYIEAKSVAAPLLNMVCLLTYFGIHS